MKLGLAPTLLVALLSAANVGAQYFSEGWQPGQPVTREAAPVHTPLAAPPQAHEPLPEPLPEGEQISLRDLVSDPMKLLNTGPVNALASKFGVNMTEKLEAAKKNADIWDHRIPLITDAGFNELIVNEELTNEELDERVWFLIITVSASGTNPFSRSADKHFDDAFNKTVMANDLPNVRWGRIDYLNVTYITTKWGVWQAPYVVVVRDRGQELRFYKANAVRLDADTIRSFLREEGWRESDPWQSSFAPGGSNEWIMHLFALSLKTVYDFLVRVPRIVLMIISGIGANFAMRWIHRNDTQAEKKAEEKKEKEAAAAKTAEKIAALTKPVKEAAGESSSTSASPAKGKASKRKGGKK